MNLDLLKHKLKKTERIYLHKMALKKPIAMYLKKTKPMNSRMDRYRGQTPHRAKPMLSEGGAFDLCLCVFAPLLLNYEIGEQFK